MTRTSPEAIHIPDRLFFRIGDVASLLGVKPYVLRYWESEFPIVSPTKSSTGQRVYRRGDVENLLMIKHLLYEQRYSIEGARKKLGELRKGGELKTYKQECVADKAAAQASKQKRLAEKLAATAPKPERVTEVVNAVSAEVRKNILSSAKELHELARAPISSIFRL
jgi:DNA-binding transcriptional MerR regulator